MEQPTLAFVFMYQLAKPQKPAFMRSELPVPSDDVMHWLLDRPACPAALDLPRVGHSLRPNLSQRLRRSQQNATALGRANAHSAQRRPSVRATGMRWACTRLCGRVRKAFPALTCRAVQRRA